MAQTLVHYAPGVIRSPRPDHPRVPDIEGDLFIDINARSVGLANGASVTSMIAEGSAPARDRTFDVKRTDFEWPTFATNIGGMPAIRLNGSQMISNGGTAVGFPAQRSGPMTYAVAARINAYPTEAGHQHRLVIGCREEAATAWDAIQPATTAAGATPRIAAIEWDAASSGPAGANSFAFFTPPRAADWFVAVVVFNGTNSIAKVFGGVESIPQFVSAPYQGMSLGIRQTTTSTAGGAANADYRQIKTFARAFTRDEVVALHAQMRADWGITQ